MSPKRAQRREQFKKLGAAITALKGDPAINDYHTGKASTFFIKNGASAEPKPMPGGPMMKTPQWVRTVR